MLERNKPTSDVFPVLNYADIDNIELSKVKQLAIDLVQIPRENVESRYPALG